MAWSCSWARTTERATLSCLRACRLGCALRCCCCACATPGASVLGWLPWILSGCVGIGACAKAAARAPPVSTGGGAAAAPGAAHTGLGAAAPNAWSGWAQASGCAIEGGGIFMSPPAPSPVGPGLSSTPTNGGAGTSATGIANPDAGS